MLLNVQYEKWTWIQCENRFLFTPYHIKFWRAAYKAHNFQIKRPRCDRIDEDDEHNEYDHGTDHNEDDLKDDIYDLI